MSDETELPEVSEVEYADLMDEAERILSGGPTVGPLTWGVIAVSLSLADEVIPSLRPMDRIRIGARTRLIADALRLNGTDTRNERDLLLVAQGVALFHGLMLEVAEKTNLDPLVQQIVKRDLKATQTRAGLIFRNLQKELPST
jgi:hypothetical protein